MCPAVISRELLMPLPGNASVNASTCYTRREGLDLLSVRGSDVSDDACGKAIFRFSPDNGCTWGPAVERETLMQLPDTSWLHRTYAGGDVDPHTGRFILWTTEGVLPDKSCSSFNTHRYITYSVSEDGGRTFAPEFNRIICQDDAFGANHRVSEVWLGQNGMQLGDRGARPLFLADGTILMPIQVFPRGPEGSPFTPQGTDWYLQCAMLIGRWKRRRITWSACVMVRGDPGCVTSGVTEPTLASLDDGRLLMVMRGSSSSRHSLKATKWAAYSDDQGRTWSRPEPWTYVDGQSFVSPSSLSILLPHSSGRLFWLGTIRPTPCIANGPRHPFVLGEVDRASGRLIWDSVTVLDECAPEAPEGMSLSNAQAREDRETHEIVVRLWRYGLIPPTDGKPACNSQAYRYRVSI